MLAILPLVAVCAGPAPYSAQASPVPSRPVLTMGDWEAPGTFDPLPPTSGARLRADMLLFQPLWTYGPDGLPVPRLAAGVPRPAAHRLTVRLRPGLAWSDGQPLNAADVVFTWQAVCSAGSGAALAYLCPLVGGVSAPTASEVRFDFGTPPPGLLAALASLLIVPAHRLQGIPPGAWSSARFFAAPDVASGPFRLTRSDPTLLVFDRNPRFPGPPPPLARIDEVLYASHDAMIQAAQAGELDYLPHLGPADVGTSVGGLRLLTSRSRRQELLVAHGVDGRTLRALLLATDTRALVTQAFGSAGTPLGGAAQPATAALLLAGTHPHLELLTVCDDPVRAAEAATLGAAWGAAGIRVTAGCLPVGRLAGGELGAQPAVALYSDVLLGDGSHPPTWPADAIPLLAWPAVRAVAPALHGFMADDPPGSDVWNAAGWWLS